MDLPASREISLTVRWLWGLSFRLSNSDSTVSTFSSVCALRLLLPGRLSTVLNFTMFFVQPLFRNSVINCQALWPLHSCILFIIILSSLLSGIKVDAFAWYCVKIRVIFGVLFERRKVNNKSKPTWKLKHANSILETFEYFCQIPSKSIFTNELYRFKVEPCFETQCTVYSG